MEKNHLDLEAKSMSFNECHACKPEKSSSLLNKSSSFSFTAHAERHPPPPPRRAFSSLDVAENQVSIIEVSAEMDELINKYVALKFGEDIQQDTMLMNAVTRLSKLSKLSSSDQLTLVLQRAMTFMEEEFRIILECSTIPDEKIVAIRRIASVMISAGYETECCQVYSIMRRNAFKEAMKIQGLDKINIDEVQKMDWEALEVHIADWIKVVKYVAKVLLPGEKRLCDSVFSNEHPSIREAMFSNLIRSAVILFLNFADAISMTERSAERLFKVLDIYETLTELMSALDEMCSHECDHELSSVRRRLGEAVVCIFCDLENSIKNDVARNVAPSGAVHPLTRFTMNYLRYACDFKETLQQVFSIHHTTEQHVKTLDENEENDKDEESRPKHSAFAAELMTIMNLLDINLEAKSKLYKDPSLRYIFLMNNGRYILQKIKESTEINELVGNDFRRKRSSELRGYHKSYQRETWSRVLQCLNQEGLQVNGKVQKVVLKERFKNFNQMFDEIHKTQSCWVVSDVQLQSELRVSISAVMIPAYRSFLGRFGQHFSQGRHSEKYIKYQPEDIESTIEGLFDGNQNPSLSRGKVSSLHLKGR